MNSIPEETGYGKFIIRGAGITFIGLALIGVSQFVLRIFLAQGLSKSEFGLFFAVFTLLNFINIFSHLGLNKAIVRFVSKFRAEEKPNLVKSSIITGIVAITIASLLISGLLIGFSNFLASSYFNSPKAVPVLIILSAWFFFMSFHNFLAPTFQGFKYFFGKTLGQLVRNLTPFIGIVAFALLYDLGLNSAAIFYLLGPLVSITILYALLKKRHYKKITGASGSFSKPLLKEMLTFGAPLILSGVASSVIGSIDTLMLTGLRSLGDVGLYEVAKLTKQFLKYFGSSLAVPLFPIVSELWAKENKRTLRNTLRLMMKFSFMMTIPVALVFLAFPEIIIRVIFGSEYLAAANAMKVLAIASIFWVIGRSFVASLSGIGKTTLVLKSIGAAAIFNIIANSVLIPPYGATGAAIATGISFVLSFILCFYYSKREIDFPVPVFPLIKTGIGGVLTLLLVYLLKSVLPLPTWPLILSVLILSGLFYVLWLFGTRIVVKDDLDVIESNVPVPKRLVKLLRKITKG